MEKIGSVEQTLKIINENDFYIKKKFGQNFIIDQNVLNAIVDASLIDKDTCVVEIGPGLGSLTEILIKRAKKVMSFEIDKDLIPILNHNLGQYDNFILVNEDILNIDINVYLDKYFSDSKKIALVANLPYYITTPIILKLLSETTRIKTYTMMMQDEVANRICSKPDVKDYNALSVCIQYRALSSKVLNISRNIFVPKPNVDSAVIRLELFDTPPYKAKDEVFFFKLIRDAFCQRRKTLVNNLKQTGYDKTVVLDALTYLGLPEAIRSEALNVEEFVKLSDYLLPYHNNK